MLTNRLTTQEIYEWCSVPTEELLKRTDLKAQIKLGADKNEIFTTIGNMMADEVKEHNARGEKTVWVLPAGPTQEYDTLVERVNNERISLKNLWVFHMDEFLDWQCRPYPVGDTYESLEGTMEACLYDRIDPELTVPVEQRIWPRINDMDYPDQLCEKLGGVDTVWAGIGATGLVAFDEAPRSYWMHLTVDEYAHGKTHIVDISDDSMVAMAQRSFGTCLDRVPPKGITIGFGIMITAKRCVYMVATTPAGWKQTVCRILLFSEPTLEYPVTIFPKYVPEIILCTCPEVLDHPMAHETKGW